MQLRTSAEPAGTALGPDWLSAGRIAGAGLLVLLLLLIVALSPVPIAVEAVQARRVDTVPEDEPTGSVPGSSW